MSEDREREALLVDVNGALSAWDDPMARQYHRDVLVAAFDAVCRQRDEARRLAERERAKLDFAEGRRSPAYLFPWEQPQEQARGAGTGPQPLEVMPRDERLAEGPASTGPVTSPAPAPVPLEVQDAYMAHPEAPSPARTEDPGKHVAAVDIEWLKGVEQSLADVRALAVATAYEADVALRASGLVFGADRVRAALAKLETVP